MTIDQIRLQLREHGQEHILDFWHELTEIQRTELLHQIAQLDLGQLDSWIARYVKQAEPVTLPTGFGPAPCHPSRPTGSADTRKYIEAKQLGDKLIASGKVAAFVVAGGQGTRLGYDGPKGNFPATPIRKKSLFQVFAEAILVSTRRHGRQVPWYIMTSPLNHLQTVETFKASKYFGLDSGQVVIFQQGTLPNFDFDGRILLADKDQIACSPDGHGGSLRALHTSGALADMRERGVEYISYWQVDNPLINLLDPLFIGLHAMDDSEMSSKALKKTGPMEKLGNFCLVEGKVTVIEYSDLPDDLANKRNPDGSLVFELGSIGIHILSRSFVERLNTHGFALPMHRAVKKIPFVDAAGRHVEPQSPNGVKLESFVFDALPLTKHSMILETIREEEFAPIKNTKGVDSVESSRAMMIDRAARWLEGTGVNVPRTQDGTPDCVIEIAPSFAVNPEEVAAKAGRIPPVKPGDQVYLA